MSPFCIVRREVTDLRLCRSSPGVAPKIEALKRMYEGKKIIVARDKLDPTKGVLPKVRSLDSSLSDDTDGVGLDSSEHSNDSCKCSPSGLNESSSSKSRPPRPATRPNSVPRSLSSSTPSMQRTGPSSSSLSTTTTRLSNEM